MNPHETGPAAEVQTANGVANRTAGGAGAGDATAGQTTAEVRELYLPFGGTDPDFYIPADRDRTSGGISRWFRALPVFGRGS
ncbi:hypothetical protein [Arthrobacter sp. PM3]|uniref:hypothetical protein n=1 Tax=Arthrobacter sp. PM3 TaxID=2017685 RepID=UPI000E107C3D|nr:hypothetical protein [Arthrobacter sp. PM3]AXJ08723.1 hypothetical protein CFN17_03095 [Arthrobacter sp. PM3]